MRKTSKITRNFNVIMLGIAAIGAVIFSIGCFIE